MINRLFLFVSKFFIICKNIALELDQRFLAIDTLLWYRNVHFAIFYSVVNTIIISLGYRLGLLLVAASLVLWKIQAIKMPQYPMTIPSRRRDLIIIHLVFCILMFPLAVEVVLVWICLCFLSPLFTVFFYCAHEAEKQSVESNHYGLGILFTVLFVFYIAMLAKLFSFGLGESDMSTKDGLLFSGFANVLAWGARRMRNEYYSSTVNASFFYSQSMFILSIPIFWLSTGNLLSIGIPSAVAFFDSSIEPISWFSIIGVLCAFVGLWLSFQELALRHKSMIANTFEPE